MTDVISCNISVFLVLWDSRILAIVHVQGRSDKNFQTKEASYQDFHEKLLERLSYLTAFLFGPDTRCNIASNCCSQCYTPEIVA